MPVVKPESAIKSDVDPSHVVEVSVVMPCLNEALTVGVCVEKARRAIESMGVRGEVIVADNGSTDGSQAIAERAGAIVVPVYHKGYGAALQGGISAARGVYVIMGDADDSYDFSKLDGFLGRLRAGDDIVMGNRFKGGIMKGAMPWHHRYVGNPVLTGVLNLFYRSGIGDAHCGLRGFRKDAFERMGLTTTGMEFASEMVVRASLLKLKVSEIPTVLQPDGRDRPPHLRSFRDGWRHLRFLLLFCPLWLFLVPAGCMMVLGLSLMVWLTPEMRFIGDIGLDVHSMLAATMSVISGYQILWLGVFAKFLGARTGCLPEDRLVSRFGYLISENRGVIAGVALLFFGVFIHFILLHEWWSKSLGGLDGSRTMREALWGLMLNTLGIQTIFSSWFYNLIVTFVKCEKERQSRMTY